MKGRKINIEVVKEDKYLLIKIKKNRALTQESPGGLNKIDQLFLNKINYVPPSVIILAIHITTSRATRVISVLTHIYLKTRRLTSNRLLHVISIGRIPHQHRPMKCAKGANP